MPGNLQDKKILLILILFIIFFINAEKLFANPSIEEIYPGAVFLMIYPGARQVGMAGAFTGIADDAFATYYNPAGLALQKNINLSFLQSHWLSGLYPDMRYYMGNLILPVSEIMMGLSWIYLSTGETEVWDENGNYLGEYTPYDMAPAISVGKKISDYLAVGGTVKYIYSYLVPDWVFRAMPELGIERGGTGEAFALDVGTLLSVSTFGKTSLGLVIQNIGYGIKYTQSGEGDPLPSAIKFGISQKILLKDLLKQKSNNLFIDYLQESSKLIIAYDFYRSLVNRRYFWQSVGTEICFAPIAFRFGYFSDPHGERKGRTIGFGIDFDYLQINVASDADIYEFGTENLRYDLSLKLPDKIKF
jgi:hypothetical protein